MKRIKKKHVILFLALVLVMALISGCMVGPMDVKDDTEKANKVETEPTKTPGDNKTPEKTEPEEETETADEPETTGEAISLKEATDIVKDRFEDFTPYKIEMKKDDTKDDQYKLKGYSGESKVSIKMDAQTGEILDSEQEAVEKDDRKPTIGIGNLQDIAAVTEVAEKEIGDGWMLEEWKLKMDDGRLVYKLSFGNNDQEAEVKVDAQTKEVVDVDLDD